MKLVSAIFSTLTILFTLSAMAEPVEPSWIKIVLPSGRQTSQIEAGYPTGCELTSILYSLKFGPAEWRSAYSEISGDTDIQKMQTLAEKFSSLPSRFSRGQPAFSKQYGMNPNDVSWMMSMLVKNGEAFKMANYFVGPKADSSEKNRLLKSFQSDLSKSFSLGKPVIMDLTFSDPASSHAVVVVGVNNSITHESALGIRILDPMTGNVSEADISMEPVNFGNMTIFGLSFSGLNVADRQGTVLSIHL
jgi:hypothetical protein